MKKRYIVSISIISIILLILICTTGFTIFTANAIEPEPVSAEHISDMEEALSPMIYQINKEMDTASSALWNTARELDGVPIDDPAVILALFKLKRDIPFSFETGVFDTDNILILSTEDLGASMELGIGKATSHYTEEDFKASGSQCIVSNYSNMPFGDNGVTITTAVYDAEGNYNGTLRVGIDTWYLFSGLNEFLRNTYGYTVWVAQDNGLVIFDKDTEEIGRNLITDEIYQIGSLKNAVKSILEKPSGNASYLFYDSTWIDLVQTNTVWNSVYPGYGMEWRIVLTDNVPKRTINTSKITPTPEELKAFVENAYVYASKNGKERALAEFNDPHGEFIDGELYIFAYGMDGETLALPFQPGLIGVNRWFMEDTNGVKIMQRGIIRAEQGGGYVCYLYPNPDHNYAQEFKQSYVMKVDDQWFIGAGVYVMDNPLSQTPYVDLKARDNLRYQVRNMQYLAKSEGISSVVEMVNDPASELHIEGLYPCVIKENGTVLAYLLKPEMAGTDQLGVNNSLGMSVTREILSSAKAGGGMMYFLIETPSENKEKHVLLYVEPTNTTTYVGSLIILE
ncbi:MAG TPA: cache domain-containing protein [Methanocorpusculum sp.]|nr:cache domain-containing protein [Methanocorpusculum sp.]